MRGPKLQGQGIRTARWYLTRWSDGQTQLYDQDQDPKELHELSAMQPDIVKEPIARLETVGLINK